MGACGGPSSSGCWAAWSPRSVCWSAGSWPRRGSIGTHLRRPAYYLVGGLWVLGSGMLAAVVATGVSLSPVTAVVIGVATSLALQWFLSFRLRTALPPATTKVRAAELERSPVGHRMRAWSFVWPSALVGATLHHPRRAGCSRRRSPPTWPSASGW